MAQSGYTQISLYFSSVAGHTPSASNLAYGELALNIADGKLFYKDNSNVVQTFSSGVSTFSGGSTGLTPSTATSGAVTLGGTLAIGYGGTNSTSFTAKSGDVAGLVFFDGTKLANDTTVTDVGYDTVTNTLRAKNFSFSGTAVATGGSYQEKKVAISASDIDMSLGNYFSKTITTSTTFTVSNVPATGTAISLILDLTDGGSSTVTWWSGVTWAGGTAPTLTTSGRDVLGFFSYDNGTTWTGLVLGLNMQ